jgi:hypothetical protein
MRAAPTGWEIMTSVTWECGPCIGESSDSIQCQDCDHRKRGVALFDQEQMRRIGEKNKTWKPRSKSDESAASQRWKPGVNAVEVEVPEFALVEPMDSKARSWLSEYHRCFRCRKPGHRFFKCTRKKNRVLIL